MSPHQENFIDKTPHVVPNFLRNVEQDKTSKFSKEPILLVKIIIKMYLIENKEVTLFVQLNW